VTNAYLLCRIADTIEDEPALSPADTLVLLEGFKAVVAGRGDALALAADVEKRLSSRTLATERDLIVNMARVLNVTASLSPPQRAAIQRCVDLMCYGMPRFQSATSLEGLSRRSDLDEYCYYVAGVVGDMLTELFCEYSPDIAKNRAQLSRLAVSFAQGLQMTNILKDVWEDRSRGACWLPQRGLHALPSGSRTPFARDRRPRIRCRHARAGRRGACAPAQRSWITHCSSRPPRPASGVSVYGRSDSRCLHCKKFIIILASPPALRSRSRAPRCLGRGSSRTSRCATTGCCAACSRGPRADCRSPALRGAPAAARPSRRRRPADRGVCGGPWRGAGAPPLLRELRHMSRMAEKPAPAPARRRAPRATSSL
jgi:phytoene/squalene synthetase